MTDALGKFGIYWVVLYDQFRYLQSFLPLRLSWEIARMTAWAVATKSPIDWTFGRHMKNRRKIKELWNAR